MDFDKRAFFNSLRAKWLEDTSLQVKSWQVDDYRAMDTDSLFTHLQHLEIIMDEVTFQVYSENVDSPEELADVLHGDSNDLDRTDQIYLLVFELWRRLCPEKPSISIFCDELDQQITLCDTAEMENEDIQDALGYLEEILNENADEGGNPIEVFQLISSGCSHDLETFLYDFIASQIDHENDSYALELLDSFSEFFTDPVWLEFLRMRIQAMSDSSGAEEALMDLLEELGDRHDVDLYLEILQFVVYNSDFHVFMNIVHHLIDEIDDLEDFNDFLNLCSEYFQHRDHDEEAQHFQSLIKNNNKAKDVLENDRKAVLSLLKEQEQHLSGG